MIAAPPGHALYVTLSIAPASAARFQSIARWMLSLGMGVAGSLRRAEWVGSVPHRRAPPR
jgi:hypothetical protein